MYECSVCKAVVVIVEGAIVRQCPHSDAPVVLQLTATATGESK